MHRSAEQISKKGIKLILKTIGNRKGDCAWSCSRWQTQPEKICKLQSTNQYNVRSEWHWFVRCDLQIFSGCVCHLEQLHTQSPFLFPIVFSINFFCLYCVRADMTQCALVMTVILKCSTFLAVISEYSTVSVIFPLTSLLSSLYWPEDPLSSLESTPVSI